MAASEERRIRFTSAILPRFARRRRSLDAVLPTLYLRGVSSGDFQEALEALLGKDASGLSAQVIGRLKAEWEAEHERWRRRDLSARRYVYMWADGIYLQGRLEDEKQCILVLIGATPEGRKELVGFQGGGCARAPRAGVSCWHACAGAGSRLVPSSPSAMALWASGRRWRRPFPTPAASAAGSTRQPMS